VAAQTQKLAWIQALRGIAALMVVMVHDRGVLAGTGPSGQAVANALLPLAMGVDLFFLISGFLMVLTTRDFDGGARYAFTFAAKRIARIWPLLAIVTVLAIAMDHHGVRGFLDRAVLLPYVEGLALIPHNPAASGLYFQMAVGVAWTLCFEGYFYLVFALCMLFGRWRYGVMALWFALTLLAIPLLRGGYNLGPATQPLVAWCRYANLAIHPMVWEFVLGMLAGGLYLSRFTIRHTLLIPLAMALGTAALLLGWHRIGLVNAFGPGGWGAPLAWLFFGCAMLAKQGAVSVPAWTVWLGEISYSLYLVHVYVFELVQRAVAHLSRSDDLLSPLLFAARPGSAVFCAWLAFRYLEAPATNWMRRRLLRLRLPGRRWFTPAIAVDAGPPSWPS
jgi:peptidoglycan/LPS O-acetylase OafA/YrhL